MREADWNTPAECQNVTGTHRPFSRLTLSHSRRGRTQFGLHESVGDSQVVGGDGLSVDHPQQSELGRQRVHDHRQVSLPHLSAEEKKKPS